MLVSEIISLIIGEFGTRFQLQSSDALRLLNQVQAMAFDADKKAFMVLDQFVSVSTGVKGPYNFPTSPLVRRFVGVTTASVAQVMGTARRQLTSDYGLILGVSPADSRTLYEDIFIDYFGRTFTFSDTPTDAVDTYRMVYYRRAPVIRSTQDDGNLLIPVEYQHSLCVQGVGALANYSLYGEKNGNERIKQEYIKPFWDALDYATDGNVSDLISEGTVGL